MNISRSEEFDIYGVFRKTKFFLSFFNGNNRLIKIKALSKCSMIGLKNENLRSEKNKQKGYISSKYQKAFNRFQKCIAFVAGTYIYLFYIYSISLHLTLCC